ncbi:MAG: hypothetical protein R2852_03760 [Bacteroidia bacterium]
MFYIYGDYYLLTAGHLLSIENFKKGLVLNLTGFTNINLKGTLCTTYLDSSSNNGKIDVSVLKLSNEIKQFLLINKQKALIPSATWVNHQLMNKPDYIISGFPLTNLKKGLKKKLVKPQSLLTFPFHPKYYNKWGFNYESHLLIRISKKGVKFGGVKETYLSSLTGMSGSGLWFVPDWNTNFHKRKLTRYKLIGVLIEDYMDKGFVASVRIDLFFYLIKHKLGKPNLPYPVIDYSKYFTKVYQQTLI